MEKTALKIKLYGDPALRKKAKVIRKPGPVHRDILSRMLELMYASGGIGLAGPQVGINEAMIVADAGGGPYKMINPRILKRKGALVMEEGCLSIPGVCVKVRRARKILVAAEDENGKPFTLEAQDLPACVIQHEIDHLLGRLIIDRASFLERLRVKKALKRIKQKARDERLPEPETKSCRLQL